MNSHHSAPGCETSGSSLGFINSLISLTTYIIGAFYHYLPSPQTLIPALLTSIAVAVTSFFVTKACQWAYRKIFCK